MKTNMLIRISSFLAIILLLPLFGFAEEETDVSGDADVIIRTVDGERESSKFEEYREIPDGVSGKINLGYRTDRYFFDLKAKDIAEDDQYFRIRFGLYGKFKVEAIYDKIPHRFAYDAKTLYSGIGSGRLVLNDAVQSTLQGAADDVTLANDLLNFYTSAQTVDIELFRKTGRVNVDVMALDPINFRLELKREERDGTRPFSGRLRGPLGGHFEEIAEPIDYDTTDIKIIAEYAERPYFLSASYEISIFENNIDTLIWENPFRLTDDPSDGSAVGLIDLAPDNEYQNVTLTGSVMELPLKSRLTATASWGWMTQDDNLVPYTANTAITDASLAPFCASQNASDPACLPVSKADLEVKTSLYKVMLTSKPLDFLRAKAKLRYYERDNDSGQISFPGHVEYDRRWDSLGGGVPFVTEPVSYDRLTTGIDLTFDVLKATSLTVGYEYDTWDRKNREAHDSNEDIYSVSVESKPSEWLDLRASYKKAVRDVEYDFTVPFGQSILAAGGVIDGESVGQNPLMRKYDEADRDRDTVHLLATLYPLEVLTMSVSGIFEQSDYDGSAFGLLDEERQIYSLDADYEVSERVSLSAYYSFERYENNQRAREWEPGDIGDPYTVEPGVDSFSNWVAEHEDKTNTVGAGVKIVAIPKRLDLKVNYLYSKTDGEVNLSSAVGTAVNDLNDYVPLNFKEVDDIKRHLLNVSAKYSFAERLSISLGYTWEKFEIEDFDNTGFEYIPISAGGEFNGAILMGTIPKDYEVDIYYAKLKYTF